MISERLAAVYGKEVPIFSEEILKEYPNYSRVYVFRKLKEEVEKGKIRKFSRGVYYIPIKGNRFSTITPQEVMEKKYIGSWNEPFGTYSGHFLKNQFGLSRQVPNVREIVSNKESSKRREITLSHMKFIVKKSRVTITKENYKQYTLLELFNQAYEFELTPEAVGRIKEYIKNKKITKKSIIELAKYFPHRAIINMIKSGLI